MAARPRSTGSTRGLSGSVLDVQLRIELQRIRPHTWRRVTVPEGITLDKLHQVIQAAMGWSDTHMHQFEIDNVCYGRPDPDFDMGEPVRDERRVRLNRLIDQGVRQFDYSYDFGDQWDHRITVEDVISPREERPIALCAAGESACPPEDVGGEPGYQTFLAAITDPAHPQHRELSEWVGYPFDPAAFDMIATNDRLRRIKL